MSSRQVSEYHQGMNASQATIGEVDDEGALDSSVRVIRDSFGTVAEELGLTTENCPTHPSFITIQQLGALKAKGLGLFGLFLGASQIGFVAVERANASLYYMEKLAVLPEHRHSGHGRRLVAFVLDHVRQAGGRKLSISTIDEHRVLKDWYMMLGFTETSTSTFPHLPFTVCFMERGASPLAMDVP